MSNDNDNHHEQPVDQPSPDLTYLHPDNLHIGHLGVFAGDWAWTGKPPRIPVGFVGLLIDYWNGWAVWRCTREVAEAVVADQQRMRELERARLAGCGVTGDELDRQLDESLGRVYFDGDDLVLDETELRGEPCIERQGPGQDGRYCPMGFSWTWQAVAPADCDRIAGVLPAFGEHREYVMATHQPLRMPHDRLTVTQVYQAPSQDRFADAAALSLDGNPAGVVGRTRAGAVDFRPLSRTFTPTDLQTFTRDCRWRGREVDTATVVQALIAEYQAARHVAAAEQQGMAAVILRDGDDHIVGTDIFLEPRPFAAGDRQGLADLFTGREAPRRPGQHQFVWQVWTGRRWQLLGIVDVPRDGSAAGPHVPGSGNGVPETGGTEQNGDER